MINFVKPLHKIGDIVCILTEISQVITYTQVTILSARYLDGDGWRKWVYQVETMDSLKNVSEDKIVYNVTTQT